jgi:hypothetical protein
LSAVPTSRSEKTSLAQGYASTLNAQDQATAVQLRLGDDSTRVVQENSNARRPSPATAAVANMVSVV